MGMKSLQSEIIFCVLHSQVKQEPLLFQLLQFNWELPFQLSQVYLSPVPLTSLMFVFLIILVICNPHVSQTSCDFFFFL